MKRFATALAKLMLSIALIALVVHAFGVHSVGHHLAQLDAVTAFWVVGLALSVVPLQTLRWMIVLKVNGNVRRFAPTLGMVLIGHFFNQTLPSSVGGDAVRAWCAWRTGLAPADAAATVVLDRVISLVAPLMLTACTLPWLIAVIPYPAARAAVIGVLIAGIGGLLALTALARFAPFFSRRPRWHVALALLAPARRLAFSARSMLASMALSIGVLVIFCYIVFDLAVTLGTRVTLGDCLLLIPPVFLASAIPVSIAGWGVREGAMVIALGFADVPPAVAFATSVLFGLTIAVASLPGAALWLADGYTTGNLAQAANLTAAASPEQAERTGSASGGNKHG